MPGAVSMSLSSYSFSFNHLCPSIERVVIVSHLHVADFNFIHCHCIIFHGKKKNHIIVWNNSILQRSVAVTWGPIFSIDITFQDYFIISVADIQCYECSHAQHILHQWYLTVLLLPIKRNAKNIGWEAWLIVLSLFSYYLLLLNTWENHPWSTQRYS